MTEIQMNVVQMLAGIFVLGWLLRRILIPHRLLRSRKEKGMRGAIGALLLCAGVIWWASTIYSNLDKAASDWEGVALGIVCGAIIGSLIMFGVLRIHTWEI